MTEYQFVRYVDEYRPGDSLPSGRYDSATVAQFVVKGLLTVVEQPEPEPEPQPTRKRTRRT